MFIVSPKDDENVIRFENKEHQLDKLFKWGLITETARKKQMIKEFVYGGSTREKPISCQVVGYIPYDNFPSSSDTVVILLEGKLHKIMPVYLKEMQIASPGNNNEEGKAEDHLFFQKEITQHKDKNKKSTNIIHKQYDYDFVAIDFETANNDLKSACSVGIVVVNNNQIIEKKYFLIKPPGLKFDSENIEIHGIRPEDVENEADFGEVWHEIKDYISHNLVVAHNASFDMSVLKCCLREYGVPIPDTEYVCSIPISTYAFSKKIGNSLAERTKALGISLENAHNALDDAIACAQLVISTLEINRKTSLHQFLTQNRGINVKSLRELTEQTSFRKPKDKVKVNKFKNRVRIAELEVTAETIDENNSVYGKNFVFTGDLEDISREESMQAVLNLGGVIKSGISKKVNYLVVGTQDPSLVGAERKSSKERKAEELIEQGIEIAVLNEEAFMILIGRQV